MKKQYFILLDSETTQDNKVADFAAIICDRKGNIYAQCAVLVDGIYTDKANHPLFFTSDPNGIWSQKGQDRRYSVYNEMVRQGTRMIASVAAVNRWLQKSILTFNPILTAYNLPFDVNKCINTGIDLTMFPRNFCLWNAAYTAYAHTKAYRKLVLNAHAFNSPTELQNMTYRTDAETMARFISDNPSLEDEPHTALEDIIFYELPILKRLCRTKSIKWLLTEPKSYNWRDCQVKDWFTPK
jgi:hypothetical protein